MFSPVTTSVEAPDVELLQVAIAASVLSEYIISKDDMIVFRFLNGFSSLRSSFRDGEFTVDTIFSNVIAASGKSVDVISRQIKDNNVIVITRVSQLIILFNLRLNIFHWIKRF